MQRVTQSSLKRSARKTESSKEFSYIGRAPVTEELNLDKVGVSSERGYIKTDAHYRTNIDNIFAIGDILTTPALAHTAPAEAIHAVETLCWKVFKPIDYLNNPSAVYSP